MDGHPWLSYSVAILSKIKTKERRRLPRQESYSVAILSKIKTALGALGSNGTSYSVAILSKIKTKIYEIKVCFVVLFSCHFK